MPRLSVIMPCYNGATFVGRTIDSVRAQSLTDWELVVVDDGSTDASADLVSACAQLDPRIRVVRQPNGYLSRARNRGVAAASQNSGVLLFLDADDLLAPHAFETMVSYLEQHPDVGAAYNTYRLIDALDRDMPTPDAAPDLPRFVPVVDGCLLARRLPDDHAATPLATLASYHQALPSCTYFRRTVFEAAGGWDTTFADARVSGEDKDMVLRIALLAPVHLVNEVLTRYRRHGANVSAHGIAAGNRHFDRLWRTKQFATRDQRRTVLRALAFDAYLATTFSLRHVVTLLAHGQVRGAITRAAVTARKLGRLLHAYARTRLLR